MQILVVGHFFDISCHGPHVAVAVCVLCSVAVVLGGIQSEEVHSKIGKVGYPRPVFILVLWLSWLIDTCIC